MDWRARVVLEFGLNAYKLGGGNDVVGGEVGHELVVEEGVEDFGVDWEEGDGAVVDRERLVLCFVHFDGFRVHRIGVLGLVDGVVKEDGEEGCEKWFRIFDDGWLDLV